MTIPPNLSGWLDDCDKSRIVYTTTLYISSDTLHPMQRKPKLYMTSMKEHPHDVHNMYTYT